jgi:hypothetical protein
MSLHRIIVQDTEASKSEFQERSFAGVAENFKFFVDDMTAATGYPHYKIYGSVDKAGLADSGGAESRAWAETVNAYQQMKLSDNHRRLFHAIFEAVGRVPKQWEVTYPSIYQSTPEEEATLLKTQADTLTTLTREGVITGRQAYQALATGQPLENVLKPLDDADVLTPVEEEAAAGPSAEEELAALLGGAPAEGAGETAEEIPGEEPVTERGEPLPEGEDDGAIAPEDVPIDAPVEDEPELSAEDELAAALGEGEAEGEPEPELDDLEFDPEFDLEIDDTEDAESEEGFALVALEQQTDSADELLEYLLGWRVDAGKGGGKGRAKRGKRTEKPNCTKGRSCGLSCVDMAKRCEPDLSPIAMAAAKALASRKPTAEGGKGRGGNQDPFDPAVNPLNVPNRPRQQPTQDPFDPKVNPLNIPNRPRQTPQDPFDPRVNPLNIPDMRSQRPASAPGKVRTSLMPPIDRNAPDAFQKFNARQNSIQKLHSSLSQGRLNPVVNGEVSLDRIANGKMGALNALSDALNPKVGLLASTNSNGEYTGFMSIKEGRNSIEISNFGTDGSQPGSGRAIFNQLLEYAAKSGKSLDTSPVESAIGFYEKMGMKGEMGSMEMSAAEVKAAAARIRDGQAQKPIDVSPLGSPVKDTYKDRIRGLSDVGNVSTPPVDGIESTARPDPVLVDAFRNGQRNATLALMKEDNERDIYVPADPVSAVIMASAQAAGVKVNGLIVRPDDDDFASILQSTNGPVVMAKEGVGKGFHSIGGSRRVPASEVTGGTVTATQQDIDAAAKAVREQGGRAVLPVPVIEVSPNEFRVVGNSNMLAVAQRAGVDPWIYIVDEENR